MLMIVFCDGASLYILCSPHLPSVASIQSCIDTNSFKNENTNTLSVTVS
jgi:hypothetical protein